MRRRESELSRSKQSFPQATAASFSAAHAPQKGEDNGGAPSRASLTPSRNAARAAIAGCRMKRKVIGPSGRSRMSLSETIETSKENPTQCRRARYQADMRPGRQKARLNDRLFRPPSVTAQSCEIHQFRNRCRERDFKGGGVDSLRAIGCQNQGTSDEGGLSANTVFTELIYQPMLEVLALLRQRLHQFHRDRRQLEFRA